MEGLVGRVTATWRRTVDVGWPVAVQQAVNTLMRTVDVLVVGLFSPAAVAAIGLGDLFSRVPFWLGKGFGSGAIALASQETGRGSDVNRDRAITQALVVGALAGVPLVAVGFLFGRELLGLLGADPEVARLGGYYLTIIFAVAPVRIVAMVAARALQGTGDTRTPMYVGVSATVLNVVLSLALGLGLWVAPTLGIVGVGLATAISRVLEAVLLVAAIASPRTAPSLSWSTNPTIARQLFAVSLPDIAGGLSGEVANVPFNAILLLFGTEVTAAYHIANRLYQQFTAPLFRAFRTVESIFVGQALGAGRPDEARFLAGAVCALSVLTLVVAGVLLFLGARPLSTLFTRDPTTIGYAASFVRTFAVSMAFIGVYFPLTGALRGAGDTRTPFYARLLGSYVFLLGTSYLLAVTLDFGLVGVFVGIVLSYLARAVVVGWVVVRGEWVSLAERLITERAEPGEGSPQRE